MKKYIIAIITLIIIFAGFVALMDLAFDTVVTEEEEGTVYEFTMRI